MAVLKFFISFGLGFDKVLNAQVCMIGMSEQLALKFQSNAR